jgi:hypothetical protein
MDIGAGFIGVTLVNRKSVRWIVLLVPALIAVLAVWGRPSAGRTAEPARKQNWEYCQLWLNRNEATDKEQVLLRRGEEGLQATSMEDLGAKMKLRVEKGFSALTVLDALGGEGWELVAVSERASGREIAIRWTFKRPK